VSEAMQDHCARMRTELVLTSLYAPRAASIVEPFNATLHRNLAKFVTYQEDWDRHLAFAVIRTMLAVTRHLVCHL
jgi:hypothetical protein